MENYHILGCIGEGSYGKVYRGQRKYSANVVALKFIPKVGKSERELRGLRQEIEIMSNLQHENIVQMLDSFETEEELVVVMDYADGELYQILEDDGTLPEDQVQLIACQLVSALYYLHSHRILHRDMKPQNILLAKGEKVKLCDFGFARAMSFDTLVLTSVKGTPLYMAPEIVEEHPYDHTADLWALGCILYELYTGMPPFYTNNIFQLASLIVKDPVRWPKDMSPVFKDFLQGLLAKNSKNRLSWPHLLTHEFVVDGVKALENDYQLPSPFTQPLSASMVLMKEQQIKEKTRPPGVPKMLAKARKKAVQAKKEKGSVTASAQKYIWDNVDSNAPDQKDNDKNKNEVENCSLTLQSHNGGKDHPRSEGEENQLNVMKISDCKSTIESVILETEDADSDEEWQGIIEKTERDDYVDNALILLQDGRFQRKLESRLDTGYKQVLDGMLEGASRFRTALRVTTNLVTLKCDISLITNFCNSVAIPSFLLKTITAILECPDVKKQPWCQQIFQDLVLALNGYFSSEIGWSDRLEKERIEEYQNAAIQFVNLIPKLVNLQFDEEKKIHQQTFLCLQYLCEVMDRNKMFNSHSFYSSLSSKSSQTLNCVFLGTYDKKLATHQSSIVTDKKPENENEILLCLSCLSAMVHLSLIALASDQSKRKLALELAELMMLERNQEITDHFYQMINSMQTCCNVLRILYSCYQVSPALCAHTAAKDNFVRSLLSVLLGEVDVPDMEMSTVIEITIHILSTIVIQLEQLPIILKNSSDLIVSIFLESQLANHTAAVALLFSQILYCGTCISLSPSELMKACYCVFTDLSEICIRCPFDYGVLDGVLLLLCEVLAQGDTTMTQLFIETGVWEILWHRMAQALQVVCPQQSKPIHDLETSLEGGVFQKPDWTLISPQGVVAALQMSVNVFTKNPQEFIICLSEADKIFMLTVAHLLSKDFLAILAKSTSNASSSLVTDIILRVTQLCCYPFGLDTSEEVIESTLKCYGNLDLLSSLMVASFYYVSDDYLEIPISLLCRLVLTSDDMVEQFALLACTDSKAVLFLHQTLTSETVSVSVICDIISICCHLVRSSTNHVSFIQSVLAGPSGDYLVLHPMLTHPDAGIKSRTCNLLGNLLKHSDFLCNVFQEREQLFTDLLGCLKDKEANVRKSASYAVGNAAFHSDILYRQLIPAIPIMTQLLKDPINKTRAHTASACGNMGLHSNLLCEELIHHKTILNLLDLACQDANISIQICALVALRTLIRNEEIRNALVTYNASNLLNRLMQILTPRPTSSPSSVYVDNVRVLVISSPREQKAGGMVTHCSKLLEILQKDKLPLVKEKAKV